VPVSWFKSQLGIDRANVAMINRSKVLREGSYRDKECDCAHFHTLGRIQ
jgi:hypothetical protein